jgi:hypothetical protein
VETLGKLSRYMGKLGVVLITAALIVGTLSCAPRSQNVEIRTWYDLDTVRNNMAGNYILMNDIDSSTQGYEELASPTANEGKGWQPIGTFFYASGQQSFGEKFEGTFDGQGYEICDLYINRPGESSIGLFGFVVEGGILKSVSVINAAVASSGGVNGLARLDEDTVRAMIGYLPPGSDVGGLVGSNAGTVSNCHASGNVTGDSDVGGLIGHNAGTVSDSYSSASVTGNSSVGALVGWNYGAVSDSFSTGNVTGNSDVGGLVGANYGLGTVTNSYSTGSVTSNSHVGGLIGKKQGDGTVSNSFWDVQTSGQRTSAGGIGKTTAEMKSIVTFTRAGWDIMAVTDGETNTGYVWNIVNGVAYPFLSWQSV